MNAERLAEIGRWVDLSVISEREAREELSAEVERLVGELDRLSGLIDGPGGWREAAETNGRWAERLQGELDRAHEALRLAPCGREMAGFPRCGTDAKADGQLGKCSRCEILASSSSSSGGSVARQGGTG